MNKLSQSTWFYMDIRLDFGEQYGYTAVEMDVKKFKYAIFLALKKMHGDLGCVIPVDILKYKEEERRAFIRIPSREVTKVWNSLLLFSSYEGLECMFRVYKTSPVLASLNMNSRLYKHKIRSTCEISYQKAAVTNSRNGGKGVHVAIVKTSIPRQNAVVKARDFYAI